MKNLNYLLNLLFCQKFRNVLKNMKNINNSIVVIYSNKIENENSFKLKSPHSLKLFNLKALKLFESTEEKIIRNKDAENLSQLEIT